MEEKNNNEEAYFQMLRLMFEDGEDCDFKVRLDALVEKFGLDDILEYLDSSGETYFHINTIAATLLTHSREDILNQLELSEDIKYDIEDILDDILEYGDFDNNLNFIIDEDSMKNDLFNSGEILINLKKYLSICEGN